MWSGVIPRQSCLLPVGSILLAVIYVDHVSCLLHHWVDPQWYSCMVVSISFYGLADCRICVSIHRWFVLRNQTAVWDRRNQLPYLHKSQLGELQPGTSSCTSSVEWAMSLRRTQHTYYIEGSGAWQSTNSATHSNTTDNSDCPITQPPSWNICGRIEEVIRWSWYRKCMLTFLA